MKTREMIGLAAMMVGTALHVYATEPKTALACTITSAKTQSEYEYGFIGRPREIFSARRGYKLFVVDFTITNKSDEAQQFTVQCFRVLNKDGREISKDFLGFGDSILKTKDIASITFLKRAVMKTDTVVCSGSITPKKSSIKWELMAHKTYSNTLVYLVREEVQAPRCQFKDPSK